MTAADLLMAVMAMLTLVEFAVIMAQRSDLKQTREDQRRAELKLIELSLAHAAEVAALYERVLTRRQDDTASIVESAVRLATTGMAEKPSALVQSPEPDAQQLLTKRVVEDTVQNGMRHLREEYQRAGMAVPEDAVLREEAEMMLYGLLPESATAGAVRH